LDGRLPYEEWRTRGSPTWVYVALGVIATLLVVSVVWLV
jgi:hypothetical protein